MKWFRFWRARKIRFNNRINKRAFSKARLFKYLAILFFVGVLLAFIAGVVLFAWASRNLPSPDKIVRRDGFATKIYDRNGQLLYDVFSEERRIPVKLEEVPKNLRDATIAIEDKNFYRHQGFDPLGWLRAVYNFIFARHRLAGGSTLTQQLVKNVLLSSQRSMTRKLKEFILSVQIEKKYSKDEILQMYLNESPYGGTAWGVEAAAETYFGKKTSELDLVESAILAGLPQSPTYYSPLSGNNYVSRTRDVLRRMREDGYITTDQEKEALNNLDKVKIRDTEGQFEAPHFVMYVKGLLEERFGEKVVEEGGLRVTTTLDLDIQKKTQKVVADEIKKVENLHITNGAALVLDPQTGEILAMVGSKDYSDPDYDGKVNVALSLRQPGSSIKPITYATAFAKGYSPGSIIMDVKTEFPGGLSAKPYVPVNYDGKDHGAVDLRHALGSSLNISSVKLLALVGIKDMMSTAYKMGLTSLEPTQENINNFGLSVTLGGGEVRLLDLAAAYSAFANSGYKIEPVAILRVEDRDGKLLDQVKPSTGQRVLSSGVAYLINNVLSDNNARLITFGQNSLLNLPGQSVAVKTGTTDDKRDNWTIGWTSKFLVGVWVGNNDNTQMKEVASGVSGASPIWRNIVLYLLTKYPSTEFIVPDDVEKVSVDSFSGYPAHDGFSSKEEFFIKGTIPTTLDTIHKKIKVCKGQTDKLANDTKVARGDYEEKEFYVLTESDSVSSDGRNRWQEGIDAWILKQTDDKYKVPKEYCGETNEVVVNFRQPHDHDQVSGNDVEIEIEAVGNSAITKVQLYVNGEEKETFTQKPYKTKLNLSDGTYSVKARATDDKGNTGEGIINIGVNRSWDSGQSSPTPSSSSSPN